MKHEESAIKVFYTKEYGRFNMINGNRQLNELKIKRICTDIDNGIDVLRYCPILVTENNGRLDIKDGQHRFYVSRKKKTMVWYIIAEEMSLYDIAKINSNTEKWKAKDFINCYVQLGNESYSKLRDLMDEYKLTVTDAVNLLNTGNCIQGGSKAKEKFEQGLFEVKTEQAAKDLLVMVNQINFHAKFTRHFINAIYKVKEGNKVDFKEFATKINANIADLQKHLNYKDYLLNMESIYNKGKQNRFVIY